MSFMATSSTHKNVHIKNHILWLLLCKKYIYLYYVLEYQYMKIHAMGSEGWGVAYALSLPRSPLGMSD